MNGKLSHSHVVHLTFNISHSPFSFLAQVPLTDESKGKLMWVNATDYYLSPYLCAIDQPYTPRLPVLNENLINLASGEKLSTILDNYPDYSMRNIMIASHNQLYLSKS